MNDVQGRQGNNNRNYTVSGRRKGNSAMRREETPKDSRTIALRKDRELEE